MICCCPRPAGAPVKVAGSGSRTIVVPVLRAHLSARGSAAAGRAGTKFARWAIDPAPAAAAGPRSRQTTDRGLPIEDRQ